MNKKYRIISFIAIILGFFMALLDTTVVNITLPKMTEYFNTTMAHISWVVNAYNLAFAAIILTTCRLADQFVELLPILLLQVDQRLAVY